MQASVDGLPEEVRKRVFLRCHFILKKIFLPRQARDKHTEKLTQKYTFLQGYWILDLEPADGYAYGYGWIYACTEELGIVDEFVYFFSRTTSLPATLESAWLARCVMSKRPSSLSLFLLDISCETLSSFAKTGSGLVRGGKLKGKPAVVVWQGGAARDQHEGYGGDSAT
jgi:hypothetical protein